MQLEKPRPDTAFDFDSIPQEMLRERRWVCWRAVQRDGRWTKVPVDPGDGSTASSIDPSTWSGAVDALEHAEANGLGIGFMLGDGWLGIDFDHVDQDAALGAWVVEWQARHPEVYLETSPSGTGCKAILRAQKPEWSANRRGNVELYEKARFFCVTGKAIGAGRIGGGQEAVDDVARQWLEQKAPAAASPPRSLQVSPESLQVSPSTADPSATDFAFVCELAKQGGFTPEMLVARLREKMEAEGRHQKAARADYAPRTVEAALRQVGEAEPADEPLAPVALADLLEEEPKRSPFVVHELIREAEVACLIAPPKCAKSFLVGDLAVSVATGKPWHGHWETTAGKVLLVDNELTPNELRYRMASILHAKGLDAEDVRGKLDVLSLRQSDIGAKSLLRKLEETRYSMVVFDALYRFLEKGMDENSNADMTVLMRQFSRFAARTGAAVLLVHHTTKGNQSGKDAIDAGAGAGSIARSVDTNLVLFRHEEDDVFVERFTCRTNRSPGALAIRWKYPLFEDTTVGDIEALHGAPKKRGAKPE